jgi:hypothetical protein
MLSDVTFIAQNILLHDVNKNNTVLIAYLRKEGIICQISLICTLTITVGIPVQVCLLYPDVCMCVKTSIAT